MPNIGEWNEFTPAKLEKVSYNNESTKQDLINLLDATLSQEPEFQKTGIVSLTGIEKAMLRLAECDIITELSAEALNSNEKSKFPLAQGWALKENQKFGKRGGVKAGSLEESEVPRVSTIQNWIGRYATYHKQKTIMLVSSIFNK
ncbi:hypothetical protein C2G38_2038385 [Gigaspora rosea]|uniref:Uncharacterized protein n=1 Tax=Gigaspora rosea TaxID=44941 RepID=A0A397V2D9_9GLOM|nr:hypothetical protein C2G38_2038385 [Gigaspora rosea]